MYVVEYVVIYVVRYICRGVIIWCTDSNYYVVVQIANIINYFTHMFLSLYVLALNRKGMHINDNYI